jgi:glycosyltransferase involved in cell wall biosynthesis
MRRQKLLSVVVNNYNYAGFVAAAIESALAQDSDLTETIVVDDGSMDDSRRVIEQFADHAQLVFKPNGGQASALNAGFARAIGQWVLFLDADDVLLPGAGSRLADELAALSPDDSASSTSKITWQMPLVGPRGERLPGRLPARPPAHGALLDALVAKGPLSFTFAPCSGNCWSREFLAAVMPMPEDSFRRGADGYLLQLSPIYGNSYVLETPLSAYRRHGSNFLASKSEFEIRDLLRGRYPALSEAVASHLERRGIVFDRQSWRHPHWDKLDELESAIVTHVPAGGAFVLIDDGWLNVREDFHGRRVLSIKPDDERDAASDQAGERIVQQLQLHGDQCAPFVILMWYSFWWLESYPQVARFMQTNAQEIQQNATARVYRFYQNPGPTEHPQVDCD